MITTRLTLLERLRRPGDEQAWARFVDLYTPLLLRWATRQGLQSADAADVIQDVMALLCRKLPDFQYDPSRSFRAWLRTILVNKCRERRRRRRLPMADADADLDQLPSAPHESDEREDRRLLMHRGLELIRSEFSETIWRAFWQHAIEGRAAAEIAAELGISAGTVYVAKSRVLLRLRQDLGLLLD